jgi:hypothetical protein
LPGGGPDPTPSRATPRLIGLAIVGIAGIVAGALTFLWPGITAMVLLFFIAGWAIEIGILEIVGAIKLRKEIDNEWLLIAGGVLSVLFGVAILVMPGAGALALVWLIGLYAIIYGVQSRVGDILMLIGKPQHGTFVEAGPLRDFSQRHLLAVFREFAEDAESPFDRLRALLFHLAS